MASARRPGDFPGSLEVTEDSPEETPSAGGAVCGDLFDGWILSDDDLIEVLERRLQTGAFG